MTAVDEFRAHRRVIVDAVNAAGGPLQVDVKAIAASTGRDQDLVHLVVGDLAGRLVEQAEYRYRHVGSTGARDFVPTEGKLGEVTILGKAVQLNDPAGLGGEAAGVRQAHAMAVVYAANPSVEHAVQLVTALSSVCGHGVWAASDAADEVATHTFNASQDIFDKYAIARAMQARCSDRAVQNKWQGLMQTLVRNASTAEARTECAKLQTEVLTPGIHERYVATSGTP